MIGADSAASRSRGAPRQGRSHHRHGRRIPGAAGRDGPLLRASTTASPPAVAAAIEQHYWPRFAGDALPEGAGRAGRSRSPTSSRRSPACSASARSRPATRIRSACAAHAIGVIRILVEKTARACARRARRRRVRRVRRRARRHGCAARSSRASSTSACAATCATPATPRTRSRRCVDAAAGADRSRAGAGGGGRAFGELPEARHARRREQADRQHPAASPGARPRPPSTAARLADGAEHDLYLAFQKLEPVVDDRIAPRAISPARCWRSRPPSRPSTASSTT